jgi:hypothetical protein
MAIIQTKDNKGSVVIDTDILQEVQTIELSKLIRNKYAHIVRRLTDEEFLGQNQICCWITIILNCHL